jgi:hypothetical protein
MRRLLGAIALTASLTAACGSQAAKPVPTVPGHEDHDHGALTMDPTNGPVEVAPNEWYEVTRCSELPADACPSPDMVRVTWSMGTLPAAP